MFLRFFTFTWQWNPFCHVTCSLLQGRMENYVLDQYLETKLHLLYLCICNIVLVLLGCCKKILQTGWYVNIRHLFLTVPEAGRGRSGCQHGQVRVLLQVAVCPHSGRGKLALWSLFFKGTNTVHVTSFMTQSPHGCPISWYHPLNIRFSTCKFWMNTNIHTIVSIFHICGINTHVSRVSHLKLVMCTMDNRQTFSQDIFCFLSYSFFCSVMPFWCLFLMATNFQRRHIIKKNQ